MNAKSEHKILRVVSYVIIAMAQFFMPVFAEPVDEEWVRSEIIAPYSLGEPTDIEGVWELLNGSGLLDGYVIETEILAPLPGFGGEPLNMLAIMDLEGVFIDVKLLNHNEPIFVSGLGEQPLREFLEQYRGQSINAPMTVGTNYGNAQSGALIYLDGVTKATASVRIAHESIMGAVREVARQKLNGLVAASSTSRPNMDYDEEISWQALIDEGIVLHKTATHNDVQALFEGTKWQEDNPFPEREGNEPYADVFVLDITPPALARAVLKESTISELDRLRRISPDDEYLLLIETADHGLVSEDFVRNTSPSLITLEQDGLPLIMKDSDVFINLQPDLPQGVSMIVRVDRRLGFDPVRDWTIGLVAEREHGMFQPEIGQVNLTWTHKTPERFFVIEEVAQPLSPFEAAIIARAGDLVFLSLLLIIAMGIMMFQNRFVRLTYWKEIRLIYLAACLGFIGWWGQGQLSIITPLALITSIKEGRSLAFLLYDPFSLLIWLVTIVSFFLWGRALFCGWLCPFGAFQEGIAKLASAFHIRQIRISARIDGYVKMIKYPLLLGLILTALFAPDMTNKAAEIEPFKTAISVFFMREWYYVLYALIALCASAFVFKGFCRYICPLGALMSIGGLLRLRPFIARRVECGSPCQLCKVQCRYQSISAMGEVHYSECFGCLDCVDIYHDEKRCVPLILKAKGKALK